MRWLYVAVTVVLIAVTLIFAVQNFQSVTVSFLNFRISSPLAILVGVIYVLGMLTGGGLWTLMRWAYEGSMPAKGSGPNPI